MSEYNICEHQRRFATWSAVTATRSSSLYRFTRDQGISLVKESGLANIRPRWSDLPDPSHFNEFHRDLRRSILAASRTVFPKAERDISHGLAAKLINVYLKTLFLSAIALEIPQTNEVAKAHALHPPIDRLLLSKLAMENVGGRAAFWREMRDKSWSRFESDDYETTIEVIRRATAGALWTIEKYWLGPDDSRRS